MDVQTLHGNGENSNTHKILPFLLIALAVIIVWLPFGLNLTPTGEMWFQRNEAESFGGIRASLERQNDRVFWFWSAALGDWLTPNTFVGHQIVFILVYFLRGVLTYLILQRLFPNRQKWALAVALMSLFNPADPLGLFWLAALHIHAHDALFLLPVYLFINIWDTPKWWKWAALLICLNVVLWSYEATLLLNLAVPGLLFFLEKTWRLSGHSLKMAMYWYISPLLSVVIRLLMYFNLDAGNAHFIRKADESIRPGEILNGVGMALYRIFVGWFGEIGGVLQKSGYLPYGAFAFIVILIFLLQGRSRGNDNNFFSLTELKSLFLLGILIIILGFLPYTFSELLRYRYDRTMIISWIGASIIFTSIFWLFFSLEKRGVVTALLCSFLIGLTLVFALNQHDARIRQIQAQNSILTQVVRALPQIEKGTAISLIYEFDCTFGEKTCRAPSPVFEFDVILTGFFQFIYNDVSLRAYAQPHSAKINSYYGIFYENRQWPLDKLIIIRYSPTSDEVSIEGEFPSGLSVIPGLDYEEYAPENLYTRDGKLPFRACRNFPDFLPDDTLCLPSP